MIMDNETAGDPDAQPDEDAGKGQSAEIIIEELGGKPSATIIKLGGHFYLKGAKELTETIESLVLRGKKNIIFDLSKTSYMNSTAIGALANCAASTKGFGGDTVLVPLGTTVMSVLEMLGLLGMFTIAATREEAIDKLS